MSVNSVLDLSAHSGRPVILLCAPAGFGKTAAIDAFAAQRDAQGIALLRLDATDQADSILSAVRDHAAAGATMIIDDADRLHEAARNGLREAFEAGAKQARLILAARHAEGLHFGRWHISGNAVLLDGQALALRRSQLTSLWTGRLTAEQIRRVDLLAEGWAAPAQLLASWAASGGSFDEDGLYLRRSLVANFVREEILADLPDGWLPLIEALGVPASFDADLARRLGGEAIGFSIPRLEGRFGPLLIDGEEKGVYRFNALLRLVLGQGRQDRSAEQRRLSEQRIADWALDKGDILTAAQIGAADPSGHRLIDYVQRVGGLRLWLTRGYDDLRAVVAIADRLGDRHPRLQLMRCVVLLKDGRVGEAARLYEAAVAALPPDRDGARDAALVHATMLVYGCRSASPDDDAIFRRMRAYEGDPAWKTMLPTLLAVRHSQQGDLDQAMADIVEARSHAQASGITYNLMFLEVHRAIVAQARGQLAEARTLVATARRRWRAAYREDRGAETAISAVAAQIAFEQGRWAEAERHVQRSGRRLPGSEAWFDIYIAAFEPMIRLQAFDHGVGAALATLANVQRQLMDQSLERVAHLLDALAACLHGEEWLRTGHPDHGEALASVSPDPPDALATWQEREFGLLAKSYAALAGGDVPLARTHLDSLLRFARRRGLRRAELRALLLLTAVADREGDDKAGARAFRSALALAAECQARAVFRIIGGPAVARHLAAVRAKPPAAMAAFVASLPSAADGEARELRLTKRERQVLSELAAGGSDKMIGRRMGMSEHAVRFHLKNLFKKFGVRDRAAAASRYQALPHDVS
ncbi:LuxR C-terminal-related transcriptional regulator [Sphingosinicella rhizophila]|uniref:LuxR C-terminal-related transcriptional regulator n=1 Tax=Sphingosinicella rhizophila TaxID=3050082 RepID=A0ABU3Q9I8_9SPHN|nr:LuxR C-terminal-related transcriptional regulator [Sphingosinicella sp. GR2756]MDT9600075.1 LuxR C-terminal-related transcriptional regulator [Sphingosinicella sp. GR2756]